MARLDPTQHVSFSDAVTLIAWKGWVSTKCRNGGQPTVPDLQGIVGRSTPVDVIFAARRELRANPVVVVVVGEPVFRDQGIHDRVRRWEASRVRQNRTARLWRDAQKAAARAAPAVMEASGRFPHEERPADFDRVLAQRRKGDKGPTLGTWSLLVYQHGVLVERIHDMDQETATALLGGRARGEAARAVLVTAKVTLPEIGDELGEPGNTMFASARQRATLAARVADAMKARRAA